MRICRAFLILFAFVMLSAGASAQTSASVVKISFGEEVHKVKRGTAKRISVVLDIDGGYHINSNRPGDKNLIATTLRLDRLNGLTLSPVTYPRGKIQKFEFSETPLSVYDGRTTLRLTARALPSLPAGSHTIKGKLTVQACDHEKCLRPQTVDVSIPILVE
ncbi:MAG TPA: protein-disulfide reductase DsbD domain-containing protein [Blastocatellia bacterium]